MGAGGPEVHGYAQDLATFRTRNKDAQEDLQGDPRCLGWTATVMPYRPFLTEAERRLRASVIQTSKHVVVDGRVHLR